MQSVIQEQQAYLSEIYLKIKSGSGGALGVMHNPLKMYEKEIKIYCGENGLDPAKVLSSPCAWNNKIIILQYVDWNSNDGRGLKNEKRAPVTLIINRDPLTFEKTEYTEKYLSM